MNQVVTMLATMQSQVNILSASKEASDVAVASRESEIVQLHQRKLVYLEESTKENTENNKLILDIGSSFIHIHHFNLRCHLRFVLFLSCFALVLFLSEKEENTGRSGINDDRGKSFREIDEKEDRKRSNRINFGKKNTTRHKPQNALPPFNSFRMNQNLHTNFQSLFVLPLS